MPDEEELDGCQAVLESDEATPDDHVEVMPLFAEALDPDSPVTVEDVVAEWGGENVPDRDT